MSVIQNNLLLSDEGYNLQRSLRFRSSASAYLNRTFASAGNRKTWTLSMWVKRGDLSTPAIFQQYTDGNNQSQIGINSSNSFRFYDLTGGSFAADVVWSPVYRDPSAWYHFVFQVDTTQATNTNRIRFYVNGTQVTSTTSATWPTQNADLRFNNNIAHFFAQNGASNQFFDGYLTEINFIDGQALTPSSFGENNAQTGVWQPKRFAGTYGTNGFYLPFSDNSSLSNLTADRSGNGNNWTANNISLTAGATYDSMTDVPTLTSATASNFAVLNPLAKGTNASLTNGNLDYGRASVGSSNGLFSTIGMTSGKWYCEHTLLNNDTMCGLSSNQDPAISYLGITASGWGYYSISGRKYNNNVDTAYGATCTTGDVVGIAFDADAGTLTFYKNGVSQGTAYTGLTSGPYYFAAGNGGTGSVGAFNFGQRPFAYTPPTGFVALNTFNLPTPTIGATASTQANKYFDATTYTANGSAPLSVVNAGGFQPDFVWTKTRANALDNQLYDSLRGVTNVLISNSTAAATTTAGTLTSFNSNGYTIGNSDWSNHIGGTGSVGWQWRANGTGVTNTAGSITSTVSANTSSGFSIVTYTGTGANATVGHGLGVAPRMIIVKARNSAGWLWCVYHASVGATGFLRLQATDAVTTSSTAWQNTAPTSTVFSIGTEGAVNFNSSTTYVAYCFAEVAGFSRFGSYTGNGSADGPFVFCGFRPRYVMFKKTNATSNWSILDTARDNFNVADNPLLANTSGAETTSTSTSGAIADILSNGFKLRGNSGDINDSGATYIFMAFAENPFKYSLAR